MNNIRQSSISDEIVIPEYLIKGIQSDIITAITSQSELTRLLPLIGNIAIIEYDGKDVTGSLDIARYFNGHDIDPIAINRILLLGKRSRETLRNKEILSKHFPLADITIVNKRWQDIDPRELKITNTLVFHTGYSAGISDTLFDQETGNGETFVNFVNKTRTAYYACILNNSDDSIFATHFTCRVKLRLKEFALDTNSKSEAKTNFCRDKHDFITNCIETLIEKDAFFQCVEETDHGCEECNQCSNYNAAKRCPFAQRKVAEFYRKGKFVPQDDRIAHQWELMAARQGYKPACIQVADDLMDGYGCTQDIEAALEIYSGYASQVGNDHCVDQIIKITEQVPEIDNLIAVPFIAQQAQDGNEDMIIKLSDAFQIGGYSLPKDLTQQKEWIQQGAENGNPRFVKAMASMYEEAEQWTDAYNWYTKLKEVAPELLDQKKLDTAEIMMLTDGASPEEVTVKGENYLFGYFGTERDLHLAHKCLVYADDKGIAFAKGLLGIMYLKGWLVHENFNSAIHQLTNAAKEGDLFSIYTLVELHKAPDNSYHYGKRWENVLVDKIEEGISNNLPLAYYIKGHCQRIGYRYDEDKNAAFENLKKAAELNVPIAQYELSEMYEEVANMSKAEYWLKTAAMSGYYVAEGKYGIDLFKRSWPFDREETFKFLKKAYDKGFDEAYWCLAQCYMNGRGTPENIGLAFPLYQRAAEVGILKAQETLCEKYFRGNGPIPQDYALCAKWGEEAIKQGSKRVRFETAYSSSHIGNSERAKELYLELCNEGSGVAMNNYACELSDPKEKAQWFQKAANAGDDYGLWNLGKLYKNGRGVEKDINKAVELFTKAANKGQIYATMELARMYHNGDGVEKDINSAISWYEKAAARDEMDALIALANIYETGDNVTQDIDKAVEYLKQAAENENIEALLRLGEMHEKNSKIQNRFKAIYWYRKAARKGNYQAKIGLKRLNSNWIDANGNVQDDPNAK